MNKAHLIEPLVRLGKCNFAIEESELGRITNVLQTTGTERVIANYLPGKLEETGWNSRMFEECKKWLKENTASGKRVYYGQKIREEWREPEDVNPEELVEPLTKLGIALIPEVISIEVVEHIFKVIVEHISS